MLDSLKFRKLDEGYTVKYYVQGKDEAGATTQKYVGEKFCTDVENLITCVNVLVLRFVKEAA